MAAGGGRISAHKVGHSLSFASPRPLRTQWVLSCELVELARNGPERMELAHGRTGSNGSLKHLDQDGSSPKQELREAGLAGIEGVKERFLPLVPQGDGCRRRARIVGCREPGVPPQVKGELCLPR
jgi:hypothetical protein